MKQSTYDARKYRMRLKGLMARRESLIQRFNETMRQLAIVELSLEMMANPVRQHIRQTSDKKRNLLYHKKSPARK